MTESSSFTYADLFAGIGGFAAALEALGGGHAYCVEIDETAAAVYEANWGHNPLGDITMDANDTRITVPVHDILTAGFPCQPFSKSGAQKGMDEIRGTLFFNIMQIARRRRDREQPTIIVLENVRNLAGPRHTHEWDVIIERLREQGYQVSQKPAIFSPHRIHPNYGGTPQVRERVFITATLIPQDHTGDPDVKPVQLAPEVVMDREWDLATDLPLDDSETVAGTSLSSAEQAWIAHWEEWLQVMFTVRAEDADAAGKDAERPPGFPIWSNVWVKTPAARLRLQYPGGVEVPAWKRVFLTKNWALYDRLRNPANPERAAWLDQWLKKTRAFPESRQKLEWQAQDETTLRNCVISLRPSGLRVKRMTHLPALVAITQTPILGPHQRRLSAREAARLQGLPDNFTFGDQKDAATYKQLGNGVNVAVVWNVLKAHVKRDKELLLATTKGKQIYEAISTAPAHPHSQVRHALMQKPNTKVGGS